MYASKPKLKKFQNSFASLEFASDNVVGKWMRPSQKSRLFAAAMQKAKLDLRLFSKGVVLVCTIN